MRQPGFLAACCVTLSVTMAADVAAAQRGIDLAGVAARLDLTEAGVRRWLEQLGATVPGAPTEQLLAVSLTGTLLLDRRGGQSSVYVDSELDTLLREPNRSVVLIHNHPANAGLSMADIGQLGKPGVAAIVAIGHDGSVFVTSAGPRFDADFFEERQYAAARAEVLKRLRAEWPSGRVSVSVSDAHFTHLVTLALAKASIVQYWFTLRGANRESYDAARMIFGQVVAGAAAQLRRNVASDRDRGRWPK